MPFFGYPASTATGPAVFALKTGAAIVPTFCIREADGTHTMKAWPPIYPEATGDRATDVHAVNGGDHSRYRNADPGATGALVLAAQPLEAAAL